MFCSVTRSKKVTYFSYWRNIVGGHSRDVLRDLLPFVSLKKRENTHEGGRGGVLLLVKLQAEATKQYLHTVFRSTQRRCSVEKGVLKKFTKLTGKHQCQSLSFNKVTGQACNFIKKRTLTQVFSFEFCESSKNTFLKEHSGRLLPYYQKSVKYLRRCFLRKYVTVESP